MEPLLPFCFCQESSVLQNTTVVDLSLVCNNDRWCISCMTFGIRLSLKTRAFGDQRDQSASPHRTHLDLFSFIQKSGVSGVTNVPVSALPRPAEHVYPAGRIVQNTHLCQWWVESLTLSAVIYTASSFVPTAPSLLLQMRLMQMGQQLFGSIGDSTFMYLNETLLWTADGKLLSILH